MEEGKVRRMEGWNNGRYAYCLNRGLRGFRRLRGGEGLGECGFSVGQKEIKTEI